MSLEEKHNYSDEKVADVAEDVHVSGVEEEHLETTHLGDHGLRRDLVSGTPPTPPSTLTLPLPPPPPR